MTAIPLKTFSRDTTAELYVSFFEDASMTVPLEPSDPSKYPSYSICNPDGIVVDTGVTTLVGAGDYKVSYYIPLDAKLTNDSQKYTIQYTLLTNTNRQIQKEDVFSVCDKTIANEDDREIIGIGIENKPVRISNRFPFQPEELKLEVYQSSAPNREDCALVTEIDKDHISGPVIEGDSFGYYVDVPIAKKGDYTALWSIRETVLSEEQHEFKQLRIVEKGMLKHISSLRILIDRFQKRLGAPNAYQDSDLVEFLHKGLQLINSWYPPNVPMIFSICNMPQAYDVFLMIASGWYGLQSQYLLETDLSFSFCVDEDTLINTEKGLVPIKYLDHNRFNKEIMKETASFIVRKEDKKILTNVIKNFNGVPAYAQEILDKTNIDLTAQKLGLLFTRLGLNKFRASDGAGYYTWDINDQFITSIFNMGILNTKLKVKQFDSHFNLDTPDGVQEPVTVWDLGYKDTLEYTTRLGYSLKATENHPVLTLDKNCNFKQKRMDELKDNDYVAINKNFNELESWDVSFKPIKKYIEKIKTITEDKAAFGSGSSINLPDEMTPELARVLGYLISEGSIEKNGRVSFCNSDDRLHKDYINCFRKVFGISPKDEGGYTTEGGKYVHYSGINSSKLVKFLSAIGCGVKTARYKEVPWSILQSPKHIAKEFLITFFEGDGCAWEDQIFFSSSSKKMLSQMQSLLLRFGIISRLDKGQLCHFEGYETKNKVYALTVRGPSLVTYSEELGWFIKGKDFKEKTKYYPKREALPDFVLHYVRSLVTNNDGKKHSCWRNHPTTGKRVKISLSFRPYCDYYAKTITYEHLEKYFNDKKETLKIFEPKAYKKIKRILKYKYQWDNITSIEKSGKARVYDPTLPTLFNKKNKPTLMSNLFYTNGMVTHNSGQTSTLDYDRTGNIDSALARMIEYLNEHLTKLKTAMGRSANLGTVGVRPYRIGSYQNIVRRVNVMFPGDRVEDLFVHIGLNP